MEATQIGELGGSPIREGSSYELQLLHATLDSVMNYP